MNNDQLFDNLVDNAMDFLAEAISEFEIKPKLSIIHFYTAIELLLKARLMREHWSLVISKDPDRRRFEAGDFHSVTFETASDRLRRVVQSPIRDQTLKNFDAVRKHRNKIMHFFHEGNAASSETVRQIASEQLRAWAGLHHLLTSQWASVFSKYESRIASIESSLRKHREYLGAKFDELAPLIEEELNTGAVYAVCDLCHFKSARAQTIVGKLHEASCRVCGFNARFFLYECSECHRESPLYDGGVFRCPYCENQEKEEDIKDSIDQFVATKDNYFEAWVPANCDDCDGYHTVVEYEGIYVCIMCFNYTEDLSVCEWCGDPGTGDMEDSAWKGCTACDGQAGNIPDED